MVIKWKSNHARDVVLSCIINVRKFIYAMYMYMCIYMYMCMYMYMAYR